MRNIFTLAVAAGVAGCATPTSSIPDAETRTWWGITTALSSDAMEGRDTGSPGYDRAAAFVAEKFQAAGLQPAGDAGTFFQPIKLREVRVEEEGTTFAFLGPGSGERRLRFLHDVTIAAAANLPAAIEGQLAFRGYCRSSEVSQVRGKVLVCFNARRNGMPTGAERAAAASAAGAVALVQIDDPSFSVEPPRWPIAYARMMEPASAPPEGGTPLPVLRYNPEALGEMLLGSGHEAGAILEAGGRGDALPSFDLPARLRARIVTRSYDRVSSNVLAVLPGTDPNLRNEYIVVGAHLDGYGYGTPIGGDALYNGTFDDAAYVATLIRLAEQRQRRGFRRSLLFAVFTGEEKGLIGSRWFVNHPTVDKQSIVGMINLDQLRPIFPLEILTVHGLEDTTMGQDAKEVAASLGIRTRLDPEPERNLISRTDHWPFLQADVPALNFVFGYEPGTDAERRYRIWYTTRYHRPADDISQPWDPTAAAKFNEFFYRLTERVADAPRRPAFLGDNPYRLKPGR